jgi:hypothetical protein
MCDYGINMITKPQMAEGPDAYERFRTAMKSVLAVPHAEIQRRIEEERRKSAANPNRRGPKRKVKPSAPA